ncbi:MAG: hypothetical protein H6855_01695 [Rhodospirillales bacterium]|nr:hypothetical protein [Rhodospirillales bacterium]MCB9973827.1 hypothetical protein [Rhodospirillales bacterium]
MIDGFYSMFFTGMSGAGLGMLALKDGEILGADAAGATYDGGFKISEEGRVVGKVTLTVPPGGHLVTGAAAGSEPASWDIPLDLPKDFGTGKASIQIKTPTGPVNVIFKKIRDIQ